MKPVNKREIIKHHAGGLSFVDIGGLWGTKGEMVSSAVLGGASRVAMADIQPFSNDLWRAFDDRCKGLGVVDCEKHCVNICAHDAPKELGHFDFVHCSGVMYHVPDLFRFIGNIIAVARKYVVIGSVVVPDEISAKSGMVRFGSDHAYLIPALSEKNRSLIGDYFSKRDFRAIGLNTGSTEYFRNGQPLFGPWWWLFTGAFMSQLVKLHGLEVIREGPTLSGPGYVVFAQKR